MAACEECIEWMLKVRVLEDREKQLRASLEALKIEHKQALDQLETEHKQALEEKDKLHQTALEEKDKLHQTALEEKDKLHQTALERMEASSKRESEFLQRMLEREGSLRAEAEQLLRYDSSGKAMRGCRTPGTTSSSNAVVYERLPEEDKKGVPIRTLLGASELAEAPAEFFPKEALECMANAAEKKVQETMNQQLEKLQLEGRWYADTHSKSGVLDRYKPDAGVFTSSDVHVAENVLFFLEYKGISSGGGITDSSRGQAVSYGIKLLSLCRWRPLVFVVLVSGSELQVAKVEAGEPERRVRFSSPLPFSREGDDLEASDGVRALWHLLRMPSKELGSYAVRLPSTVVPARYRTLAVGGYSTVFLGEDNQQPLPFPKRFVLKVFGRLYPKEDGRLPEQCYEPEYKALRAFEQLRDSGDKEWKQHLKHLPELMYLRDKRCASVPEGLDPNASVPPAAEGQLVSTVPKVLYMEYAGTPSQNFNAGSFYGIVLALKVAHKKAKRVHRDIRPPNVTFLENGAACLIDWGLSAAVDSQPTCICHDFSPIRCPCNRKTPYGPQDDLCSLVLLYVYMIEHRNGGPGPGFPATPEDREKCWKLTGNARRLYGMALDCDYDSLAAAWRTFNPHPHPDQHCPPTSPASPTS